MRIYQLVVIGILGLGLFGNAVADLNDGLVAYYPFDGNANDESGNGHNGVENGGISYVYGKMEQAASFDGIDDYIYMNFDTSSDNTFTYSFWLKDESQDLTIRRWLSTTNGRFSSNTACIREEGGKIKYYSDGVYSPDVSINWKDNNWHLFTVVSNGQKTEIYYDGNVISSVNNSVDPESGLFVGGYYNDNSSRPEYTKGAIDDVRIYDRALSESEIQQLYHGEISCNQYTQADLDNAIEQGKQICKANPAACGIDVTAAVTGEVKSNLDISIPSINYNTLLGSQDIWVELRYLNNAGQHTWGLKEFGVNQ